MLSHVERVQIVVRDREAAVATWRDLFGAEKVGEDGVRYLNAHRTTVQAGVSLFDFLEPAGPGPVAEFAAKWTSGLYGVGFSSMHQQSLARHFDALGARYVEEKGDLYLAPDATHGMPTVITPHMPRAAVGHIRCLYEVTNPVADATATTAHYAELFGLDERRFSHIESKLYGYRGSLTLFNPPAYLDRVEVTETFGGGAMDRFYQRRGPGLYMCYIEKDDVAALAGRLRARGARFTDSEDRPPETGLFIHPSAIEGMLMGVSRTNYAWVWSGRPDLAGAEAAAYAAH